MHNNKTKQSQEQQQWNNLNSGEVKFRFSIVRFCDFQACIFIRDFWSTIEFFHTPYVSCLHISTHCQGFFPVKREQTNYMYYCILTPELAISPFPKWGVR